MELIDTLMKKAQKYLQSAAVLLELEDFDSCTSRAYFAMLYAAQAALLQEGYDLTTRQGIRSTFDAAFVQSGTLPERASKVLNHAAGLQEIADYGHDFAISQQEAEQILQEAEAFVNSLARLIELHA